MSRLLVVGATGLLGRAVCQRANAAGYQVRALVRLVLRGERIAAASVNVVFVNDAFCRQTGYDRDWIIGRNCRFLRGPTTEDDKARVLREGIHRKQPVMVEIINYKKDGTRFRNAVMVAPIFDAEGEVEYFLGSQVELPEEQGAANDVRRNGAAERVERLSRRQKEILVLMAAGKLNKQIAYELGLSERTVKMHRSAVLKGLDVKTSADAIRVAIEAGF